MERGFCYFTILLFRYFMTSGQANERTEDCGLQTADYEINPGLFSRNHPIASRIAVSIEVCGSSSAFTAFFPV